MMNANNAYFLNLKRIGHEYEAAAGSLQSLPRLGIQPQPPGG